ncbi:taste receptor type 2 member 120-like [Peromyscus californicus insignis]|uniref:taste receptor type 2 member 120-like n=1 Tax=Peromyscus californicus insignis TaxID=564181 RepID=UPI0022A6F916|nr:taste receptor type 2 member 120-like [Peromyscus californicus insignis]
MNLLEWIVTIIIMTEFLLGNCANIFIILVNAIDCVKRRKISSADRIITALVISRIGLLWAMSMNWHSTVFTENTSHVQIRALGRITWAVSNHFSNWLGTSLSIFYLLKIANFYNPLFLHLKRKIEKVLLVIFLGTFLLFALYLGVVNINKIAWVNSYEGNVTLKNILKDFTSLSNVYLFSLINIIPFCVSLTCVLLLVYSLGKHLRNMKFHGKGCQDPSTMVHIKALQTLISFLLLYATYSLCVIISGWNSLNAPVFLFCMAIGAVYPTGHSIILIWGSQKLKQALLLCLKQVRC